MARNAIYSHATLISGSNNPAFQISHDAWNAAPSASGMLGFSPTTKTLSSNTLFPTDSVTLVNPHSGNSDTLNWIDYTQANDKDVLFIFGTSGNTITIANNAASPPANSAPIITQGSINKVLSTTIPMILMLIGTTQWQEIIPYLAAFQGATNTFSGQNTFTDTLFYLQNNTDSSKKLQFNLSGISSGQTRTITVPDANTTLAGLSVAQTWTGIQTYQNSKLLIQNPAATFAYTIVPSAITNNYNLTLPLIANNDTVAVLGTAQTFTAAQTLTGAVTFTPSIATSITINPPTAPVGSSSEFIGDIAYAAGTVGFITTAQTGDFVLNKFGQATLTNPSSGTVPNASTVKIVGAPIASTNVTITNAYSFWVAAGMTLLSGGLKVTDTTDATKILTFSLSGMTTAKTLSISSSQSTTQTLTIPNITGADTLDTLGLAQTFTATKTFTTTLLRLADIMDANGNVALAFTATASAVDGLTFVNAATANPANVQIQATGTDTNIGCKFVPKGTGEFFGVVETMVFPLGAESGNLVAGTYNTYYVPRAGKIIWAYIMATVAPTTTTLTLDVAQNGTSIFSTKPSIAATKNTSNQAGGNNGVLTTSPTTLAQDDKLEFKVNTNDTGLTSAGVKIVLGIMRTS